MPHPFLSDQWFDEAKAIRDKYAGQGDAIGHQIRNPNEKPIAKTRRKRGARNRKRNSFSTRAAMLGGTTGRGTGGGGQSRTTCDQRWTLAGTANGAWRLATRHSPNVPAPILASAPLMASSIKNREKMGKA